MFTLSGKQYTHHDMCDKQPPTAVTAKINITSQSVT